MAAGPIVKSLQILKDLRTSFMPGGIQATAHQLGFQRGEEALDHGVVPTIAGTAHRAPDSAADQPLLIRHRPILTASIRMMEESDRHGALLKSHLERAECQGR